MPSSTTAGGAPPPAALVAAADRLVDAFARGDLDACSASFASDGEEASSDEREGIGSALREGRWLAVHEHLSPHPLAGGA